MLYSRLVSGARICVAATALALAVALPGTALGSARLDRVSVAIGGAGADSWSTAPAISGNGRFIAFTSSAGNLVLGDSNGTRDIFVRDRLLGTTERVSVANDGSQANGDSDTAALSGDGRFVVFVSTATNLVTGDTNGHQDVFVRDRLLNTTERVSVSTGGTQADADSIAGPAISANGQSVAFASAATNLQPGDTNGSTDIFVHDMGASHTTARISVSTAGTEALGWSYAPSLSAEGRFIAYQSDAANLVPGDFNSRYDVFVRDRATHATERVSVSTAGAQSTDDSKFASISGDGRFVAFTAFGDDMVAGDTNGANDVVVRDRTLHTTSLVSVTSGGAQANGGGNFPSVSADGRFVAFQSGATNLVPGDTNGFWDLFVRDRLARVTERVSVATGGTQGNANSAYSNSEGISGDGRFVALDSAATNFFTGDLNGVSDVFLADRGQLAISVTRSPSKSSVTYKRKSGVAKFTLAATVKDARGVRIASATAYLQSSANGKTGWHRIATIATNASGVASKAFKAKKRSTTYYRWVVPVTDARLGKTTSKQKVVIT